MQCHFSFRVISYKKTLIWHAVIIWLFCQNFSLAFKAFPSCFTCFYKHCTYKYFATYIKNNKFSFSGSGKLGNNHDLTFTCWKGMLSVLQEQRFEKCFVFFYGKTVKLICACYLGFYHVHKFSMKFAEPFDQNWAFFGFNNIFSFIFDFGIL